MPLKLGKSKLLISILLKQGEAKNCNKKQLILTKIFAVTRTRTAASTTQNSILKNDFGYIKFK